MNAPETAVVEAVFENAEGRRAVSFAVRADTICAQVRTMAALLPPATWTARPGQDVTGRACPPHGPDVHVHPDGRQTCGKCGATL